MAQSNPSFADTPADHVARAREIETSRIKLDALAGALVALPGGTVRARIIDTEGPLPLLRVWDTRRAGPSLTTVCLLLAEGWRYTEHPTGGTLADADGVAAADAARPAAVAIAARIGRLR